MAPIAGIELASSPVNGRPRAPCSPDGNEFLVEKPGVEPGTPILQGSTAARCLPRARSWFRATLSASSARRFHQISLPGALARMPVIETGPDEWRSPARPSSYTRVLPFVWWEADGIEPLARRDRVYSAATAPACPYLRFPIVSFIWLQGSESNRPRTAYETAWVPDLPAEQCEAFHLHRVQPVHPRSAEFYTVLTGGNVRS